jgi:excisionase family DNA binding protein
MLSIEEAAKYLRVSKDTVRRAIKRGDLAASRLKHPRGHYRIKKSDLDALFQKQEPESPPKQEGT